MLNKPDFVKHILDGIQSIRPPTSAAGQTTPDDDFDGFDVPDEVSVLAKDTRFAQLLLRESGFGDGQALERDDVILGDQKTLRFIPPGITYWKKTAERPFHILLLELEKTGRAILSDTFHRKDDTLEDDIHRIIQDILEGFERGGAGRTADRLQGPQTETLCVVSVLDDRSEKDSRQLVCFGTKCVMTNALEVFALREEARDWDRVLAEEHLGQLFERHFEKLGSGAKWQDAFVSDKERRKVKDLLSVCQSATPEDQLPLKRAIRDLLDEIAGSFGLKRKGDNAGQRLVMHDLPENHSLAVNPEEAFQDGFCNPVKGMRIFDREERLLGYIVYVVGDAGQAIDLRQRLKAHNHFHNVLVVIPEEGGATLELWQGKEPLQGRLVQGSRRSRFDGEGGVIQLLSRFFVVSRSRIRNPRELAEELAHRARYLRHLGLLRLHQEAGSGTLTELYKDFKASLIHDLSEQDFANAFAETITYGLLTARWAGKDTLRQEKVKFARATALRFLPRSSPFLNSFFAKILTPESDQNRGHFLWLVDDIADLLNRIDVGFVFGEGDRDSDPHSDPVIHFYEPFLAAYDAARRKGRGVYYTPRPVVSFIVRSVHELLQTEFGLEDGLADTTTWGEMLQKHPHLTLPPRTDEPGDTKTIDPSEAFVKILDPATGTATFLVEVIDVIHRTLKAKWTAKGLSKSKMQAEWNQYVATHLLTRLYGYELMMAPYAIAHLKISLKLAETGYTFAEGERARIYLTNALEPKVQQLPAVGFEGLAAEAKAVNEVKWYQRFTVVIGNPPYSGSSANTGQWISTLLKDYYQVDGSSLGERNSKWIQDDYVKFIRVGQFLCSQCSLGLLGLITNHGYIDNPTFRGMRQSLLSTFSTIMALDLHGNVKKKEVDLDGLTDENIFDIQQGVSIVIAVRDNQGDSRIEHGEMFGYRAKKYQLLTSLSPTTVSWKEFYPEGPFYLFFPQDETVRAEFQNWKSIREIMPINVLGFQTHRDSFAIAFDEEEIRERCERLRESSVTDNQIREQYSLTDNRDWSVARARSDIRRDADWTDRVTCCLYRPFDMRWCYFSTVMMDYPRRELLDHVFKRDNLCLLVPRQVGVLPWQHVAVSDSVAESCLISTKTKEQNYNFPLYLYPHRGGLSLQMERRPNFSSEFIEQLSASTGKPFAVNREDSGVLEPIEMFGLIYSILHSPTYRVRYSDFLKTDFPRIPLPGSLKLFQALSKLGNELVSLHLMESARLETPLTIFIGKSAIVEKVSYARSTVFIDKKQMSGFEGVREDVWNFHIGGYQVCEKWLKDRKGRTLSADDITHYHKIVVALSETIRIMSEIDEVIEAHGGWPGAFASGKGGGAG